MNGTIIDVSREFFGEVVRPILESEAPDLAQHMAIGVFGYGSEVLRLDDEYSQDHHWGLRVNVLMPRDMLAARGAEIEDVLAARLPSRWRGFDLGEYYSRTKGVSLASLEDHLTNTIGIDHPPRDYREWLAIPEEDITHVVAGEVWHDPSGRFSAVREALAAYYPEPVRIRRLAHWCRYFSGMGTYALKRALLRDNELYASTTFARALRWGVQMAFMLDRTYYPYDKWLTAAFRRLPRMAARLGEIVDEAPRLSTPWERKLALLDRMADVIDATMVEDGLIDPHPKFRTSSSSGYRLLENAYAELVRKSPPEIRRVTPTWDQIYWEQFHSGYVDGISQETWRGLLNLQPEE
jgi:hypothetical protein